MAIAAAIPRPAEVITWARGSTTLRPPRHEGAGPAGGIDRDEAGLIDLAAQARQQTVGMRQVCPAG